MSIQKHLFQTETLRNLGYASLAIWLITCISYSILNLFMSGLDDPVTYMVYCGLVSFCLSIFMVFLLPENEERPPITSRIIVLAGGFLLYFSVNGIQAVYAGLNSNNSGENMQTANLIPFIDSRPWLPSATDMEIKLYERDSRIDSLQQVNYVKDRAIDSLANLLASCGLMTEDIFLTVVPNSREVPNGGTYRAEVVLAAKLDESYVKKVTVNELDLPIQDGVAVFEELSQIGLANETVVNLNFAAEIELFNEIRTITTFDSYRTTRPYIEASSQSVNNLYLNCGNQLNIEVPALGNDYNPKFVVSGGEFRYGNRPGLITVVPNSKKVNVSVYNQDVKIGDKSFGVRRVPSPTIKAYAMAGEIDLSTGVSKDIQALELRVVPDPDFVSQLPKDAQYRITASMISLISGGVNKGSIEARNRFNLGQLIRNARSGDHLRVEVTAVQRKNFKGDIENVIRFSPQIFSIPLR